MDPKVQGHVKKSDAIEGLAVTLYSKAWKSRVVEGIIKRTAGKKVHVQIDLSDTNKIHAPGTLVNVIADIDASVPEKMASIGSLRQNFLQAAGGSPNIIVLWSLHFCCRTLNFAGNDETITIKAQTKKMLPKYSSDNKSNTKVMMEIMSERS